MLFRFSAGVSLCLLMAPVVLGANTLEIQKLPRGATMEDLEEWTLTSHSTAGTQKSNPRLYLYGGPGSLDGRFEDANGAPDWQSWFSRDETQVVNHWHLSTFNAENLNGNGAGNQAMWCGLESDPFWFKAPGYGNNWNDALEWRSGPLADPSAGQVVDLELFFNHESEAGYDFLRVQYEKGGSWITVYSVDGTNKGVGDIFAAPGVQYSLAGAAPIVYDGNDYGGENGDEIVLRLAVGSDGFGSDQDGFRPTTAGAAQVDDITVSYQNAGPQIDFTDFEGSGPFAWNTIEAPFVGDFAKIFAGLTDLDPCLDNASPQLTFIDDGSAPNNAPGQSTGGSTSNQFSYGTPGGWTVNDTGGLAGPGAYLKNVVWSPSIGIDLPGTGDDEEDDFRYVVEYEAFDHHVAVQPGIFPTLAVSQTGVGFFELSLGNLIYFAPAPPLYYDRSVDITDELQGSYWYFRVGFRLYDFAPFLGYSVDGTPAPFLDNVRVYKQLSGPLLSLGVGNMFQDAFPAGGSLDLSTQAARDALDVVVDGAQTNAFGDGNALTVSAKSIRAFGTLLESEVELYWVLDKNPLFEDAIRSMPAGSSVSVGTGPNGWDQLMGVAAATEFAEEEFWFDLPDVDFFYPGDRLRYYIRAQDVTSPFGYPPGPVTTLPEDIGGFQSGENYDPSFEIRALPSYSDPAGAQPEILVADYGRSTTVPLVVSALGQIGLLPGVHFDYFQARNYSDPALADPLRGASASRLAGYSSVVLSMRQWPDAADYDRLEAWHAEAGDRLAIHLGDDVVAAAPASYRSNVMSVQYLQTSVESIVEGQQAPRVLPQQPGFLTQFVANDGCYRRGFDAILPSGGATTLHGYELNGGGGVYAGAAASVLHDRLDGEGDRIIDVTLPIDLGAIEEEHAKTAGASARSELLAELLALMGHAGGSPTPAPQPTRAGLFDLRSQPNPFNPSTEIRFRLGQPENTTVQLFDTRGRFVVELHRGRLPAGTHTLRWLGVDAGGARVGSGVYFVRIQAGESARQLKLTLLE